MLWLGGFAAFAQNSPDDVKDFTLPNGMKFLVLEDHSIPTANMYFFWKVGSRNEVHGITGLSHFFEHMMFNGAKKYGPKEFDRTMEANGGSNNAYTTQNVTVYTDWFQKDALETIFKLEADRIADLSIDSAMVQSERGVVLSERSTGLENSNYNTISELVESVAFQEHPYMFPVIGFESDIKSWTQTDLENYFRTYYSPNNATVVVVGDVTLAQVKKLADQYMAPIPARGLPPKVRTVEPEQNGERRVTTYKDITTPNILLAYHTPETGNADYYALDLLNNLLTSGNSSRLTKALVMDTTLASEVFSFMGDGFDPNLFQIYAVAGDGVSAQELEKAVEAQIDDLIQKRGKRKRTSKGKKSETDGVLPYHRNHQRQGQQPGYLRGVFRRLPQAVRSAQTLRKSHPRRHQTRGDQVLHRAQPDGRVPFAGKSRLNNFPKALNFRDVSREPQKIIYR